MLNEAFKIDSSSEIWVNGTSLKRYIVKDKDGIKNRFNFIIGTEPNIYNPIFLTNNVKYAIEYAVHHVSKDFANNKKDSNAFQKAFNEEGKGRIVFVRLANGVPLFDFADASCWNDIGVDQELRAIFDQVEPFFAFSDSVRGENQQYVPIEFVIAKIFAKVEYAKANRDSKNDEKLPKSILDVSAINALDGIGKQLFQILSQIDIKEKYKNLFEWYVKVNGGEIDTDGNIKVSVDQDGSRHSGDIAITTSKKGKLQWNKGTLKILPSTLTDQQAEKVQLYAKLLSLYSEIKDQISEDVKQQLLKNNGSSNEDKLGCMDIMQATLHVLIGKKYDGYYCPEYIGRQAHKHKFTSSAIAIWNKDIIQKTISYDAKQVQEVVEFHDSNIDANVGEIMYDLIDVRKDYAKYLRNMRTIAQQKKADQKREMQRREAARIAYEEPLKKDKYVWFHDGKLDSVKVQKMEDIRRACDNPKSPMYRKFTLEFANNYIKKLANSSLETQANINKALNGEIKTFVAKTTWKSAKDRMYKTEIKNTILFATDSIRAKDQMNEKLKRHFISPIDVNVTILQCSAEAVFKKLFL